MTGTHGAEVPLLGPEIPAGSREHQWVAGIIRAVEQRTGIPSRWNGRLYEEPSDFFIATAHDDGNMTVSRSKVLDPVGLAYSADRPLTADELRGAHMGAYAVTHEARHFTSMLGDQSVPGAVELYSPDEIALEEGLTDTWAHRNADVIIQDIGMDRDVPGVLDADHAAVYTTYNAATDGLVQGLSEVSRLPPDQVRLKMHESERTQRWNAAADLVIDQRLGDLMPPDHRSQIRTKLAQPLRRGFSTLPNVQLTGLFDQTSMIRIGQDRGREVVAELDKALGEVETHYRNWYQQNPEAGPSAEPPRMRLSMADVIQLRREQAAQQQPPAQPPEQADAAVDPEVAKLQRFLGGQPPAGQTAGKSAAEPAAVPNNVRQLRPNRNQGPSVE